MSDEIGRIEDPAVATYLARLEGRFEAIIAGLNMAQRTLEQNSIELRSVSDLASKHDDHDRSIQRLWEEIEKRDRVWDERLAALSDDHKKTRDKLNAIAYYASGVSSVALVLAGLLAWIGRSEIDSAKATTNRLELQHQQDFRTLDERADRTEIWMAGDPNRPYRR